MAEIKYKNREIDEKINNIKEDIAEKHVEVMTVLRDIKEQTTRTNGRVTALETWRWVTAGGIAVISWIIGNGFFNIANL